MSGRNGMLNYQVEIKQEAAHLVLDGHMMYAAVAEKLNIRQADRIKAWVRMYRREGELLFHKPIGRPLKVESAEREVERLRMENAVLKNSIILIPGLGLIAWGKNKSESRVTAEFYSLAIEVMRASDADLSAQAALL